MLMIYKYKCKRNPMRIRNKDMTGQVPLFNLSAKHIMVVGSTDRHTNHTCGLSPSDQCSSVSAVAFRLAVFSLFSICSFSFVPILLTSAVA